jgi:putative transcriptional regulator
VGGNGAGAGDAVGGHQGDQRRQEPRVDGHLPPRINSAPRQGQVIDLLAKPSTRDASEQKLGEMAMKGSSGLLGRNVRARRNAAGMTQAEVAHRLGGADATISRLERGKFAPSQSMVEGIAKALGCTVADLYEAAEKAPKRPTVRPSQAKLITLTDKMTDAEVDDVVRAIRVLIRVGQRTSAIR